MGERAIHFPHPFSHRRRDIPPISLRSDAQKELARRINNGSTRTAIDDQIIIVDLSNRLTDAETKLSRRGLIAGATGTVAGTTLSGAAIYKLFGDNHHTTAESPTPPFSSTLNPEALIGENPLQAVDYLWRVTIPYSPTLAEPIDVTVESPGLEESDEMHINASNAYQDLRIFTGPDHNVYRYVYAIPSNEDNTAVIKLGKKNNGQPDKIFAVPFESVLPEIGDRTGTIHLEEDFPQGFDGESLLSETIALFTEGEKLLPEGKRINLWIPSLPFNGRTVVNESNIGIVGSFDMLTQPNAFSSEIPYLLGKLLYKSGFGLDGATSTSPDILNAYSEFNATVKEYTKEAYLEQLGGQIIDGQITVLPEYLNRLTVGYYDLGFTKAANKGLLNQFNNPEDVFAQMYTLASNATAFDEFQQWYNASSTGSEQRVFNKTFWDKFLQLINHEQSGISRPEVLLRVNKFIKKQSLSDSSSDNDTLQP